MSKTKSKRRPPFWKRWWFNVKRFWSRAQQRLSYWVDNQLAKGTWVLIGWLAVIAIILVGLATAIATFYSWAPQGQGPLQVFWDFLFQALTPNPFDVTAPQPFLVAILIITLVSLLMVSILIGLLTNEIDNRLEGLRRGRSKVLEKEHTLILGWSHEIFTIISELVLANENRKQGAVIVILADKDKVDMDTAIRERVHKLENTRVICRSGTPMDLDDLEIVSPQSARSVIVLPPDDDNPDSYVIKTILAIINNPHRREKPYHIVTQLQNAHNLDVVRMIGSAHYVYPLLVGDQIARIVAQTSRQSGLSVVYTELLNFSGSEIYFQTEHQLTGRTYGDALLAYETSAVIGIRCGDGRIVLNPPMDQRIEQDYEIIAVSLDDDTVKLSDRAEVPLSVDAIRPPHTPAALAPERGLILGWNSRAPLIIRELDYYVTPGSALTVVANEEVDPVTQADCKQCQNQQVTFERGDISDRQVLNRLNVAAYQHIIVLADETVHEQAADAETMVTLLHLRDIADKCGCHLAIVSEMLDLRNRRLAEISRADDFIVSDHLISLMLAQLSENGELYSIFNDLFDSVGPELYFKPVSDYLTTGQPVSFYTLVEAARRRGETAIGYRLVAEANDPVKGYGVYTNPNKSERVAFSSDDKVVVLADRQ